MYSHVLLYSYIDIDIIDLSRGWDVVPLPTYKCRQAIPAKHFLKRREPNELASCTIPIKCAKICRCARCVEKRKKKSRISMTATVNKSK